ncbi:hypothetical protein FRACYDRAFT_254186 [Fragilariopsis cylindrus CCMP1102]|uniref:Uncharacterized protein n=1 Tax=Fragilariopsis cylindrus CCMP1102 TaxID=635003 RepID=A0A1E7EL93_9STRA|nr:hypothetical protein FRACYDRAFT_254186 [Fragilariopsis cylindrus CCMP1102]|eukprot:OEU06635.1 hypothetical protein FRACYDRAFT_254186 [Fragilariopsis cylindrus CCMP1102]
MNGSSSLYSDSYSDSFAKEVVGKNKNKTTSATIIQNDNHHPDHHHDPFIRCLQIPLLATVESFTFRTTSTTSTKATSSLARRSTSNNFHLLSSKIQSTSASVAYLDSISYQPPSSIEDGLLSATSKYLDALSSASASLLSSATTITSTGMVGGVAAGGDDLTIPSSSTVSSSYYSFLDHNTASLMDTANADTSTSTSTSSDILFQEVIQRVTQEFSSTLDAFAAGSSSSTLLSVETTPHQSLDKFQIWKQQIEDGTWTAPAVPGNTLNTVTTATKAASIISESATATAAPFVNNDMNAAAATATVIKPISDTATKAATTISQNAINAKDALGDVATTTTKAVSDTASNVASVISETAFNANTALGSIATTTSKVVSSTGQGLQNSINGFVSTTTQNFNQVMSTIAETTSKTSSSVVDTAGSTSRSVFNGIGSITNESMNAFTSSASSASQTTSEFVGSAAAVTKAAIITAKPGTAVSSSAKITAMALAQQQGFGSSNSNGGGGDIQGLMEMIVATVVAIPRALMDVTLQDSPNAIDDMMNGVRDGLYNDLLIPLSMPLQTATSGGATATTLVTPIRTSFEQAQAVLKTLQMILGLVVGIPRAIVEGITGQTITEVQYSLSQIDINGISQQLQAFASAIAPVLVSLLKVVANSIAFIATATTTTAGAGAAGAGVAGGSSTATAAAAAVATSSQIDGDVIPKTITFILEDLLPAFIDGLALIVQQFIMLLIEGGSAIVSTL